MLLMTVGVASAADGEWVSNDGKVHKLSGNAMFISEDGGDADRFDLSEMRDGETRTFGVGARAVTVSRRGDVATISRSNSGGDVSKIDIACNLGEDTCTVVTFADDPEKVMVAIEKERVGVNGEGDCDAHPGEWMHEDGAHVIVEIDCDGEECDELQNLQLDEIHEGLSSFVVKSDRMEGDLNRVLIKRMTEGGEDGHNVFVQRLGEGSAVQRKLHRVHMNSTMLRCPEGDATLSVTKEEAEETFLCPKHSTPLEKVEQRQRSRVIHVESKQDK
jgi:hypothetical protein